MYLPFVKYIDRTYIRTIISKTTLVKNSSDYKIQSATKIFIIIIFINLMIQIFDDLWANRSKTLEDRDLNSLQVHRRYKSLPNTVL